jgi:predicted RNA-binding protein YlqC (UPF0109 family)
MIGIHAVAETLKSIVEIMVRTPQSVRVKIETSSDTIGRRVTSFDIDVRESDRGRLISRGGANMRALRVPLNSVGYVSGTRYPVSCNEGSGAVTPPKSRGISRIRDVWCR